MTLSWGLVLSTAVSIVGPLSVQHQPQYWKLPNWGFGPDWGFSPGVGVTKPISSVPLFPQILSTVKTHFNYKIWRSYLTGVTAAELGRHLPNMNVI